MQLRALTWNLFHGRDRPPDDSLLTCRSRLLRISERNATHVQVNRDLYREFAAVLTAAEWDLCLLQECPPHWSARLASDCTAEAHQALTSRNSLAPVRRALASLNPDLIASSEGGSNTTLVRGARIVERRDLELTREPERRVMAFTRSELAGAELFVANVHASTGRALREQAEREVLAAAEQAVEWAGITPLVFGGDLNLRPAESQLFDHLDAHLGLRLPTAPDCLDHLLARGLEINEPPTQWPPERRECNHDGRALRLSDHAPVQAAFDTAQVRMR